MVEVGTSDMFDDTDMQVAVLEARIATAQGEMQAAALERRRDLGWWVYGAHKHIWRLRESAALRSRDEHRFVIHEADGEDLWAVCSCGARFLGEMHEDFTLQQFRALPGHVRGAA